MDFCHIPAAFAGAALAAPSGIHSDAPIYVLFALLFAAAIVAVACLNRTLRRRQNDSASSDDLLGDNSRFLRRDNLVGSFRIDLTDDTVSGGCKPVFGFPSNRYEGPLDELVDRMRRLVHPSMQDDFFNQFRRQNLLYLYDSGIYSVRELRPGHQPPQAPGGDRRKAHHHRVHPLRPAGRSLRLVSPLPHRPRALRHGGRGRRLPQLRG